MKGKNFSTNNTGKRKKSDFYETPYSLTWLLLENEADNDFSILTLDEGVSGDGYDIELFGEESVH